MGLFDKLRGKKASPDASANSGKIYGESIVNTLEKLNNVLNSLGSLKPDAQAYIRQIIKTAENELKYGKAAATSDISEGDELLGDVADRLAKALIRKDSTATSYAVKVIWKAVNVRRDIQPYADKNASGAVAYYERILKCGKIIMDAYEIICDTNSALKYLSKEKTDLEIKLEDAKRTVQTLRDSNPYAAAFIEKFKPDGSQKLSDCDGALELADAINEYKETKLKLDSVTAVIRLYKEDVRKLQEMIDDNMRIVEIKNSALTEENHAKLDALLKETKSILDSMQA